MVTSNRCVHVLGKQLGGDSVPFSNEVTALVFKAARRRSRRCRTSSRRSLRDDYAGSRSWTGGLSLSCTTADHQDDCATEPRSEPHQASLPEGSRNRLRVSTPRGSYLDGIPVSFAEVAFLAQRLKVVENRLAILGDWEDVVYVKCHSMPFGSPATPFAGRFVSDQDVGTKPSGDRRSPLPLLRFPISTK